MPTQPQINKTNSQPDLKEIRRVARMARSAEANKAQVIEVPKDETVKEDKSVTANALKLMQVETKRVTKKTRGDQASKVTRMEAPKLVQAEENGSFLEELRAMATEAAQSDSNEQEIQCLLAEITGAEIETKRLDETILQAKKQIHKINELVCEKNVAIESLKAKRQVNNRDTREAVARIARLIQNDAEKDNRDCSNELSFDLAHQVYSLKIPTISDAMKRLPLKVKKASGPKNTPARLHQPTVEMKESDWCSVHMGE